MKKLLFCALLALPTLFLACSKDDVAKDLTKDEAVAQIQATNVDLKKEIADIKTNKGVEAIVTLTDLADAGLFPEAVSQLASAEGVMNAVATRSNPFKSIVKSSEGSFDFSSKTGKYTYTNGHFVRDRSVTDKIVILYPAKGSISNNAELVISSFEEQYVGSTDEYLPIKIEAELKVDNATVLKISYKAALGNFASQGIDATGVASFDLVVALAPYSLESHQTLSVSNEAYSVKDNSFLKNGSKMLISTGRELASTINSKTGDLVFNGNAFLQLSYLKLAGSISYSGTLDQEEGIANALNKIDLNLYKYPEGNRIGKVLLQNNAEPMIEYCDGTKAALEGLFQELVRGLFPEPM